MKNYQTRKSHHFLFLVTLTVFVERSGSVSHNFCDNVKHGSYFQYTCCDGTMFHSKIDIQEHWQKCAISPAVPETIESVYDSMWRVYICILKHSLSPKNPEGASITLSKYAKAMVKSYDEKVKKEILDTIKDTQLPEDDQSGSIASIQAIIVTYHEIERAVCEGDTGKKASLKKLTQCKTGTDILRLNVHARADCCNGAFIPMRLTYLRHEASDSVQSCTLGLMKDAGAMHPEYDPNRKDPHQQYQVKRKFNESDGQQTCLQSCVFMQDMKMKPDFKSFLPFNYTEFGKMMTSFFSPPTQEKVLKYVQQQDIEKEVDDYLAVQVSRIVDSEFSSLANKTLISRLFRTCEAHNTIVRLIERGMLEQCGGEAA